MSITRRLGSGHPRQTSRREDRHIVRNARICKKADCFIGCHPDTGSIFTRVHLLEPYEGASLKDIWDRGAHYVCCPSRPPIDASVWSGATHEETGLQRNGTRSSLETSESKFNLSSDDNRVRVWRPRGKRLNPAFALQRHIAPTAAVMEPFFNKTMFGLTLQGFTKLSPHYYYPSLAYPIPRFVSNRACLGSFGTVSSASEEFEQTRGKATANMERNVSRKEPITFL
ncbi:transposable element Tcb1 transposase [Trichonephila clavipes]|nr:transposable element Tcb1 transposase [Trichonephila clavipes]